MTRRSINFFDKETGENVFLCYHCVKCTSGCPLVDHFDLSPNQIMRAAQLGMEDMIFESKSPWLCASCQTCTTRCPQGIDIAKVMDFIVGEAIKTDILEQFDRYTKEMRFESGMEMIEGIVTFYLHMAGSMEDRFLLLHRHDAYEMAMENAVFRGHLEAIFTSVVDVFERALLLGQEDGSIEKTQGKKTAFILFSMVDGLVRLDTFKLYHGGSLYDELISSCRRMLQRQDTKGCGKP